MLLLLAVLVTDEVMRLFLDYLLPSSMLTVSAYPLQKTVKTSTLTATVALLVPLYHTTKD